MPKKLWQPGESGNPAGRPPKSRALTFLLEQALNKTIEVGGKRVARKRIIAEHVAEAIATGQVTLPDENKTVLELSPKDWMEFTKWLYTHIDGGVKQQVEHTGQDGEPIAIKVKYAERTDDNPA